MFEDRSEQELIIIYVFIALAVACGLATLHYFQGWDPIMIVVVANIWFACLFYILYLPLKVKRARRKEEEKKK